MDLKLQGKIVLITGASRGLGYATARVLSQEEARLAINSRTPGRICQRRRVYGFSCSLDYYRSYAGRGWGII